MTGVKSPAYKPDLKMLLIEINIKDVVAPLIPDWHQ